MMNDDINQKAKLHTDASLVDVYASYVVYHINTHCSQKAMHHITKINHI